MYIYGGVSGKHIEGRLWVYNMTTHRWKYQDFNDTGAVAGHTAVVVGNVMYIIFGHSPMYGYMHNVKEVVLGKRSFNFTVL